MKIKKVTNLLQMIYTILWSEVSSRDLTTLRNYFETNTEKHRMNKRTYQHQKCVITLPPSSASRKGENETTVWFLKPWNMLLFDDKKIFCGHMGQMINLTQPTILYVNIRPSRPIPVIFYIKPILTQLDVETFSHCDL